MTYEDFIKKFNRKIFLDKYWSYFISIGAIGIGLYFLYLLNFTEWYQLKKVTTKNITPLWAIYAFCGLFIFLGLYGFWIIPKNYGITYIKSDSPIDKKAEIINQLIHDFKLKEVEQKEQYQHFKYVGRFWSSFNIYIFYDINNFYLNVQPIDFADKSGFIDFGVSKRVTLKIKKNIVAHGLNHGLRE